MHNFRRALGMTLLFVLVFALFASTLMMFYFHSETFYYEDSFVRQELAGQIDTVILGASHGFRAFVPTELDRTLGCRSYNLSGAMMTMRGRYTLLKKELKRNPIRTVIIELSDNALTRDRKEEGPEGDIYLLGRLDSVRERICWFFSSMFFEEYLQVISDTLHRGVTGFRSFLSGNQPQSAHYQTHGFIPLPARDWSEKESDYQKMFGTECHHFSVQDDNLFYLLRILELCEEKQIEVILVTTPVAHAKLCRYRDNDVIREYYLQISQEHNCIYYDFNLLKNKRQEFSDAAAFFDYNHLSGESAVRFTNLFAHFLLTARAGKATDEGFFSDYQEAFS